MKITTYNGRQSNIELLRILCMLFILIWHFNLNAVLRNANTSQELNYVALFVNSIAVVAVNTFILISGYFSIKIKLKSILGLLIQTEFYQVLAILLYAFISVYVFGEPFQKNCLLGLTPFQPSGLWFIPCYFQLLLISPILNWWCKSKDAHKTALIFLFSGAILLYVLIGYQGCSLYNFILLYLIGRWIYLYPEWFNRLTSNRILVLLSLSILLTFMLAILWIHDGHDVSEKKIYYYSTPWVIFSSVLIFLFFRSRSVTWKWIMYVSPSVLSVYLFHENSLIKQYIYIYPLKELLIVNHNDFLSYFLFLLYGILLFFCIVLFDKYVRMRIQERLLTLLKRLEVWSIIDSNLIRMNT